MFVSELRKKRDDSRHRDDGGSPGWGMVARNRVFLGIRENGRKLEEANEC